MESTFTPTILGRLPLNKLQTNTAESKRSKIDKSTFESTHN